MNQAPRETRPSSPFGAGLRRLRRWLATLIAVVVIAAAVVVGIGRLLIPYADELRPWLEQLLSQRIGQPVSIERVAGRWPRLTPSITLHGLRTGPTDAPWLEVGEARLELNLTELFTTDRNPLRLVVLGIDLALVQGEDGRWSVEMEQGARLAGPADGLQALAGDLLVRDARIRIAPLRRPEIELVLDEGEIRRRGGRTGLLATAHLAAAPAAPLNLAVQAEHPEGVIRAVQGQASLQRFRAAAAGVEAMLPAVVDLPPDRLDLHAGFDWQVDAGVALDLSFGLAGSDDFDASGALRFEWRDRRIDAELIELVSNGAIVAEGVVIAREGELWGLSLPALELAPAHALIGRWLEGWRNWPTALSGRIEGLDAVYRHPGSLHRLDGRIRELAVDMPGDRPAITGLDLELGVSGDRAALSLGGSPVLDWPAKMRQPIPIDSVSGRVILAPRSVELDQVRARRPEAEGRANGWIWLGGGRPFMDFLVQAERIDAIDPRPWLPAGQIPPRTLAWLDRALIGVGGASGGLNYHFRLGHSFRNWHTGAFQAWADFVDADLDYWHDWPPARRLRGRVEFVGRSLEGRVERGMLGGVAVAAERIRVDDLTAPELELALRADPARSAQVRALLADFPFEGWSRHLDRVRARGSMSIETQLVLPFRSMADWRLQGRAVLAGVDLDVPVAGLRFPGLTGSVSFDRDRVGPAELSLSSGPDDAVRLEAGFDQPSWLELEGRLSLSDLLAGGSLSGLSDRLAGAADWQVRLSGRETVGWQLEVHSELEGLALDLPEPLVKLADERLPLVLHLAGADAEQEFSLQLGEALDAAGRAEAGQWRFAAGVGEAAPALPELSGFELSGRLGTLDLERWAALLSGLKLQAGGAALGGRMQLEVGRLVYGGLNLEEIELDLQREPQQWSIELAGTSARGEVVVPMPLDSGRVVAVDLRQLHLEQVIVPKLPDDLGSAPVPAQTQTRVPTDFPPLHLLVEDLVYRDLPLGRLRVESHRRGDGIEIERVELAGPHLELGGHGRWIMTSAGPATQFEGRLISAHLGPLLEAFGYESGLNAARTQLELAGSWPGAPADFSLARLDGSLRLVMTDGSLPEARPGAGRLLGLVSLSAVPRRLLLDFRDVFAQGLKFDRAEGRFELSDGVARTDGLSIDSPAADITVSGVTDLGARTYDQLIVVEPEVSNTLPVLGGLAGGPAGAAAGLILRSLLERPLQGIAEARYRVTGPWEDPQIELIETRPAADAADQPSDEPD